MSRKKSKHRKETKNYIQIIFIVIFIISICAIIYYFYNAHKHQDILNNIKIDEGQVTEETTERMLQIAELKKENEDIIGWLEIEGTNINYPVCQSTDNDYYIRHNYKKEYSKDGAIFLDKDYDWNIPSSNLLLYGHNNKNGTMFQSLLEYAKEDFYKEHTKIRFTTNKEDSIYEIISVFYSRVYYKSEQNVFRYYYFVNAENEEEYNEFVNNAKKSSIYNIETTAKYGDQLLTLSTCEYSQEDGRFVVVAKKMQ